VNQAALTQLEQLLDDLGRLRRRVDPGSHADHLIYRCTGRAEILYWAHRPTAAEVYRELRTLGYAEDAAVREALEDVDSASTRLRCRHERPKLEAQRAA
jgi:hypothetical protein